MKNIMEFCKKYDAQFKISISNWGHYVLSMTKIIEGTPHRYALEVNQEEIDSAGNMDVIFDQFVERVALDLMWEV